MAATCFGVAHPDQTQNDQSSDQQSVAQQSAQTDRVSNTLPFSRALGVENQIHGWSQKSESSLACIYFSRCSLNPCLVLHLVRTGAARYFGRLRAFVAVSAGHVFYFPITAMVRGSHVCSRASAIPVLSESEPMSTEPIKRIKLVPFGHATALELRSFASPIRNVRRQGEKNDF
jgi:hypothetical protein